MSNAEMSQYWNESAGPIWVAQQEKLDAQIGPFGALARERAAIRAGEAVLDVGCGCGGTTLELAQAVGAGAQVTAVDISRPMLELAAQRAREAGLADRVVFRLDDAQTAVFDAASFDLVFSRFGVMFFADPVAAFDESAPRAATGRSPRLRVLAAAPEESLDDGARSRCGAAHRVPGAAAARRAGSLRVRRRGARARNPGAGRLRQRGRTRRSKDR